MRREAFERRAFQLNRNIFLARERIVGHRKLGLLQALDLVSDARGGLELQIRRRFAHFLFQMLANSGR
jgi:hypothetical protein